MVQKNVANFTELKNAIEDSDTTDIIIDDNIAFSGRISRNNRKYNYRFIDNGYGNDKKPSFSIYVRFEFDEYVTSKKSDVIIYAYKHDCEYLNRLIFKIRTKNY